LTDNYPVHIAFDLGEGASIDFYLAPKISDNDS